MKTLIGIDPDKEKSGVAVYRNRRIIDLKNMPFFDVITMFADFTVYIKKNQEWTHPDVRVYLEAGWLNKTSSFHPAKSKIIAARIGKAVGMNHMIGLLFKEYMDINNINYELIQPTKYTPKLNAKQFKAITGWQGRTNQEVRDAGMLVWGR